jgi:hypothetical protein
MTYPINRLFAVALILQMFMFVTSTRVTNQTAMQLSVICSASIPVQDFVLLFLHCRRLLHIIHFPLLRSGSCVSLRCVA